MYQVMGTLWFKRSQVRMVKNFLGMVGAQKVKGLSNNICTVKFYDNGVYL